jgi:hypothetical protein
MVFTRDHKTRSLFDQWSYLGPKRMRLMERSWAGLFRRESLAELPVDDSKHISPNTLWNFRSIVMERELDGLLFNLLFSLVQGFKDTEGVASMTTYKLFERVLRKQCRVEERAECLKSCCDAIS